MTHKFVTSLALAACCLAAVATMPAASAQMMGGPPPQLVTNGPQPDPGDRSGQAAAQQNVRESQQYEQLLRTNPGFLAARIHKECDPVTDPQLHASCVASFGADRR